MHGVAIESGVEQRRVGGGNGMNSFGGMLELQVCKRVDKNLLKRLAKRVVRGESKI